MAHARLVLGLVGALFATGCGGAAAEHRSAAPVPAARIGAGESFSESGFRLLVSPRFFVALPLPDASEWRVDDQTGRWLAAAHARTKSMLWVRAWREGAVVSHRQCEAAARSFRPDLLGHDESVLGDRRPLGAPEGFDTELAFSASRNKDALGAVVAAFGAHVRQCLVVVYATRAEGPDAEEVVSNRVEFIVDHVFSRVENRKIDDRIAPLSR